MSPGNLGDIGDIWGNFSRGWATSTAFPPSKNPFSLERLIGEKNSNTSPLKGPKKMFLDWFLHWFFDLGDPRSIEP